ncbi:MAG: helix-turn-helix domain-containing protein [Clostridia bacterium]|nr:helix-turn-helix domain-containing protein [Clostridia bacterium]
MTKFVLDGRYGDLLKYHGINLECVLKKAMLPADTFAHRNTLMTEEQYFRFMEALGTLSNGSETAIKLASTNKIESFSPPIFASYCSKNGKTCIERLAKYKKLIGPLAFNIKNDVKTLSVTLESAGENELPQFLIMCEMAFLVNIIRSATGEHISPVYAKMGRPADRLFSDHLGCRIDKGDNLIAFELKDLEVPFISHDDEMWSFFEGELNKRLSDLDVDDSISARVRSALTELLPSGECGIENVAEKLGLTKRTLQRKLNEENTTFQKQLNGTRELLAKHYIGNTDMNANDIAFLLGYAELNSFLRAFRIWTGMSISEYKSSLK